MVKIQRCYINNSVTTYQLHVFCDASERAYGAVAYLRGGDNMQLSTAFVLAKSHVAPKKQLSIPRLELCAALVGAQIVDCLKNELTIEMTEIHLWSDSTTVLKWLQSETCRFKVFVGTRVTEILHLTTGCKWHYVNTHDNPADDIKKGRCLSELVEDRRWNHGPAFLVKQPANWPVMPNITQSTAGDYEVRTTVFCTTIDQQESARVKGFKSYDEMITFLAEEVDGAAPHQLEVEAWKIVQRDSFTKELDILRNGKELINSRLNQLNPILDETTGLICVGGRIGNANLPLEQTHPVILDPAHHITKLLIMKTDEALNHPGAERLFAYLRRRVWILTGREAIRGIQRRCQTCQRWRAKPSIPKMSDLPPERLRLFKPVFYSTGMDCFGPMVVKIGRRTEKRWGIVYKCLTVGAIHLELLDRMDTDPFLMSFRRFVSRKGRPAELKSDCGTNFKGGDAELKSAFRNMTDNLKEHLLPYQVRFTYNPPLSPHFGGSWEREVRSVKDALHKVIGEQVVTESVLYTLLVEIEGIINSKPLGYVSSDSRDVDPVTPNVLLMGRFDPVLPQVIYSDSEILTKRRWRHCQIMADHFWKRFIDYYLPNIQIRQKWWKEMSNIAVGKTVMIVDKQLPRGSWPIGKIVAVMPSVDERVRTAEVEVSGKKYVRPVVKLIKLPELK